MERTLVLIVYLNPLHLLFGEEVVTAKLVVLCNEGTDHDTHEEIEEEEAAYDCIEDEEDP